MYKTIIMSAEENKAAVRHFWQDHLNTGNATLCENDFAPGAVNHDPNSPPVPPGPEGMAQLITLYRTAFPDLTATVEDMVAEGDKVAYRLTFRGTHQGELMGMPATGKYVTYTGIGIDTVVNGTITDMWLNFDALGMLQQLGAVPSPGEMAKKAAYYAGKEVRGQK
jgi:steroid delta-isomerase-like uncharacterized protein